jgi:NAD(P)-dependent dehydrogenase (short-subunit alcohol dehydrogenase family)
MKKVLVTGATGGIGQLLAKDLLDKGHFLVLHGHSNMGVLERFVSHNPDQVAVVQADLARITDIERLAEAAKGCDVVLHAAGVPSAGMSWKISVEEFRNVNAINYEAPFFLTQKMVPEMRSKGWGRIIFFSSVVAQTGIPGTTVYSASKSALFGLTRTLASELAPKGITVNCIAPGYMDVGMIREIPEDMREEIIAKTPIAQLSDSRGLIKMVELLLSDEANSITGQVLSVNGGLWM